MAEVKDEFNLHQYWSEPETDWECPVCHEKYHDKDTAWSCINGHGKLMDCVPKEVIENKAASQ